MKKGIVALCIFLMYVLLTGCQNKESTNHSVQSEKEINNKNENTVENNNNDNSKRRFSVWTTYWDTENIDKEFERMEGNIDTVCYFAAYFNENKEPFIPDKTVETYEMVKKTYEHNNFKNYLTFVNDLIQEDGTSSLKDTELLYWLFSSEDTMKAHIEEILNMTINEGFDGIEIDYEAMKDDMNLWKLYVQFIQKLNKSATLKGLSVRIVLEPNVPAETLVFPEGPEYVLMCYNLYGYGTKPGPKANPDFLLEMIDKMQVVPGKVHFAVATGGFDFGEDNVVDQITELEAMQIEENYNVSPLRDEESQCLVINYVDEDGLSHEVWYADNTTIDSWFDIIETSGEYGLSLWRIGGNITIDP